MCVRTYVQCVYVVSFQGVSMHGGGGGGGGVLIEEEGKTGVDIMVLCERLVQRCGIAFRKSQTLPNVLLV